MRFGLSDAVIGKIHRVFAKYDEVEEVLIYGSRAKGNHRPGSDIDLTFKGEKLDLKLINQIDTDLDDLLLPYNFDLSIYRQIDNPDLLEHIRRVGRVFYGGS